MFHLNVNLPVENDLFPLYMDLGKVFKKVCPIKFGNTFLFITESIAFQSVDEYKGSFFLCFNGIP